MFIFMHLNNEVRFQEIIFILDTKLIRVNTRTQETMCCNLSLNMLVLNGEKTTVVLRLLAVVGI